MFKKIILATEYIVPILDVIPTADKKGIESGRYIGNGVFISNNTLLTCKHVLKSAVNTLCIAGNLFKSSDELQFIGLGYTTEFKYADLATAKIRKDYANPFKAMEISYNEDIVLGQEIINYSYVQDYDPDFKISVVPRLNRGYIMRSSKFINLHTPQYLEINFPALRGMSGSPIIDFDSGKILGLIYENYRSEILEDQYHEYEISDNDEKISEKTKTYKVIEYAKAINLSKYEDFIRTSIDFDPEQ